MGKRELVALLSLSFWCLVVVVWLFLAVPWVCLQFVVFPDHTHLLFLWILFVIFFHVCVAKMSCLFFEAFWSPDGKELTPWLSGI